MKPDILLAIDELAVHEIRKVINDESISPYDKLQLTAVALATRIDRIVDERNW